jgi:hypothetical protein
LDAPHVPEIDQAGNGWVEQAGDWQLESNGGGSARPRLGGTQIATVDIGVADNYRVDVELADLSGTLTFGIVFRFVDVSNYFVAFVQSANYTINDVGGGDGTLVGPAAHGGFVAGDILRVDVQGSNFDMYINDSLLVQASSASHAANTAVGMWEQDAGDSEANYFDDFTVQRIGADAPSADRAAALNRLTVED